MKKSIAIWQLCGFVATSLLGTLLHFLFEWTNKTPIAAAFCAVNESTWEHMKILFFPMLLFAVVQGFFFREYDNFWNIKLRSISIGLTAVPVLFYTYNGAIGKSPDWMNILIFFIAAAAAYGTEYISLTKGKARCSYPKTGLAALCLLAGLFILCTFVTPKIGIFRDPLTAGYGFFGG